LTQCPVPVLDASRQPVTEILRSRTQHELSHVIRATWNKAQQNFICLFWKCCLAQYEPRLGVERKKISNASLMLLTKLENGNW